MSEATVPSAAPPPLPAADPGELPRDFPTWINPMIVKELRQGLRTKTFLTFFIVAQVAMLLRLILGLAIPNADGQIALRVALWISVGIGLCLLAPLRTFVGISGEAKANTLDLLLLTRQGPLRVAFGKWIAAVAQVTLAVVSILPYILAQYFVGGTNVISELALLTHFFLLFLILSAATLALSSVNGIFARILGLLGLAWGAVMVGAAMQIIDFFGMGDWVSAGRGFGGIGFGPGGWGFLVELFITASAVWLLLEVAASRFAPPGLQRSWIRRLGTLGIMGVLGLLLWLFDSLPVFDFSPGIMVALIIFAGVIALDSLTEAVPPPGARKPWFGSFGGWLLAPGPHTGALFCGLLILMAIGLVLALVPTTTYSGPEHSVAAVLAIGGIFLLPAVVVRFFLKARESESFQPYLLTHLAFAVFTGIMSLFAAVAGADSLQSLLAIFPLAAVFQIGPYQDIAELIIFFQGAICFFSIVLIFFFCRRVFSHSRVLD